MSLQAHRELEQEFKVARRHEQRAQGEMNRAREQMDRQRFQLDAQLNHHMECVEGLRTARESGFSIAQIREYKLLLKHLETVMQEQQHKADISQVKYEDSRKEWEIRQRHSMMLQELVVKSKQELDNMLVGESTETESQDTDEPGMQENTVMTDISGKRLSNKRQA